MGILIFLPLTIGVLAAMPYLQILNGFFQQDEWVGFAWFIVNQKSSFFETIKFFFGSNIGHYNPLSLSIQYPIYYFWGLDYSKFALFGIILHSLVTIAVYFLAKILFDGRRIPALFTALIFGVFAASYQGVSWTVVNISTLGAALFGAISAISFFLFHKKEETHYLTWSLVLLFISLLFKETTLGLFLLYFLLAKKKRIFIAAWGLIYIAFRILLVLISGPGLQTGSTFLRWDLIVQNFFTLPLKSISQILIPAAPLKGIAFYLTGLLPIYMTGIPGSPEFETFAVKIVLSSLSIIIGIVILAVSGLKFRKFIPLIGLGWVIINSLVFSFAPETKESVLLVDSRNLYFSSIGLAIFLVSTVRPLFLLLLIVLNLFWLNNNLLRFVEEGSIRKEILSTIKSDYPKLPNKAIFYTQSDTAYYGLPGETKIVPFQSGLGQTLLVYYHQTENFPKEFFKNRFLWEIDSQGYKEVDGVGFGYFRDPALLNQALIMYNLNHDSVIAYSWEGETQKLKKINVDK